MLMVSLPFTDPFARNAHRITQVHIPPFLLNLALKAFIPPKRKNRTLSGSAFTMGTAGPNMWAPFPKIPPPSGGRLFAEQGAQS